ncbi:MAG: chloride channel protein [Prevotellaceae bacterium]|jgi:CIC family chloride channel protein|nr:chloride channel protein [Prevotellaceae bacterium]
MKRLSQLTAQLSFQLRRLPERRLTLLLALAVGVGSGLAAVLLKNAIHFIRWMLTNWFNTPAESLLYIVYPGVGMLLSLLFVRYVVKADIGHGITKVLYAISRKKAKIKGHNTWSSMVTSAVTIGFGGSVGAEAPIVYTGAAIGSKVGQVLHLKERHIALLLGCGAAGAIAGIFKAPLAGIVFTLEILMFDLTMTSILPLLVSSVTATAVSFLLLGDVVQFPTGSISLFSMANIPYYISLGVFCGFASLYFTRGTLYVESLLKRIERPLQRWLCCAIGLGALIFLFPPLYGEGYDSLSALLNENVAVAMGETVFGSYRQETWFVLLFFGGVLLLKILSMSFTNSGGGVGGTFGPTLFMGGVAGFLVARLINLSGMATVPEANFALVGMAGMMAGVMQAPLTAIFLIAEITKGYDLLMPLMLASAVSFVTVHGFEKHSIYTKRLALRGDLITHDKDKAVLTRLSIQPLIETNFNAVLPEHTLGTLIKVVSRSHRNLFPVIDIRSHLLGVVLLDDIRPIMFDAGRYDSTFVRDLMQPVPATVEEYESMESVLNKFEQTGAWNLPVVSDHKYIGFVSKSKIFNAYRQQLQEFSYE